MLFAVSIQWNIIGFLCVLLNWIIKAWYILCNEYVADMRKRQLNVDWKAVNGAAKRKRILHFASFNLNDNTSMTRFKHNGDSLFLHLAESR